MRFDKIQRIIEVRPAIAVPDFVPTEFPANAPAEPVYEPAIAEPIRDPELIPA